MQKVLRHVRDATRFSLQGLGATWKTSTAFRIEVTLAAMLAPIGIWLVNTGSERALLILPIFVVLITELLNSSMESAVDRISMERHELSGRAKDMGSAAVFASLIAVPIVWALVLLPL